MKTKRIDDAQAKDDSGRMRDIRVDVDSLHVVGDALYIRADIGGVWVGLPVCSVAHGSPRLACAVAKARSANPETF